MDENACNEQGETALHAVTQNLYDFNLATKSPLIDELLRKGADINLRDKNGKRPADGNMGKFRSYLEQRARQLSGSSSAPDGAAPEADFAAGVDWQFGKNGKTKNLAKAAECYQRAAAAGHAGAQNNIGYFYHQGWGVTKDMKLAAHWYKLAAEQGLPLAQSNYGTCLEFGWGVRSNRAEAIEWYRKAARQGNPSAQKHLRRLKQNW